MELRRSLGSEDPPPEETFGVLCQHGAHSHIYTFATRNHVDLLRTIGIHAADPDHPLTWGDAAGIAMSAWEKVHHRKFRIRTGVA